MHMFEQELISVNETGAGVVFCEWKHRRRWGDAAGQRKPIAPIRNECVTLVA